jgi:hypothetical protein
MFIAGRRVAASTRGIVMTQAVTQSDSQSVPPTEIERKFEALNRCIRPVPKPPRMRTVNGGGWTMGGHFKDPDLGSKFFGLYGWHFTHGMQVTVRSIYLLSHPVKNGHTDTNAYLFHGEISKDDFERIYPGELKRLRRQSFLTGFALLVVIIVLGVIFGWWKR